VNDDVVAVFAEEAARAFPTVRVTAERFADHMRSRVPSKHAATALAGLHGADLFVAFACLCGDVMAWKELDRAFLARVAEHVRAIDASTAFADEVRQRLAEKLTGATSKLASYSGRGPLAGWLRVAAIREAQSLVRRRRPTQDTEGMSLPSDVLDPEIVLMKRAGTAAFRKAFDEAVASLPDDERSVLKLHYLDGLTLDEVGTAFRTSRATAARLISQARQRIAKRFERRLRDELGANSPNMRSLLALVESQLGASIGRCFRDKVG